MNVMDVNNFNQKQIIDQITVKVNLNKTPNIDHPTTTVAKTQNDLQQNNHTFVSQYIKPIAIIKNNFLIHRASIYELK